ncbi:MAG: 1,4-alpha-glucan branching protein GlgB [Bryobacterales bacterium]|nr:1,4-alpha-glucan branching protein GlgB [Bryobacterales bacterium]
MDRRAHPRFLTDWDLGLLASGCHYRSFESLGAHLAHTGAAVGTRFAVWAPNADSVSVIGDFNHWDRSCNPMVSRGGSGVWEGFVEGVGEGDLYKYSIVSERHGFAAEKADPYALAGELAPRTASKVCDLGAYQWSDSAWMAERAARNRHDAPVAIYEAHLGSWMRLPQEGGRWLTYLELADRLAAYVEEMGFTHVELLPVTEHPFGGSWGYQTTGYFAPTSRFGSPCEFMALVDRLHQRGIGVVVDWAPAHFPDDPHGLARFDGTCLYEHVDPRRGRHPHWGTLIFNYGRVEVTNFLVSSALFWCEKYHVDGIRVDAVASMLYLDYGREEGEWIPNRCGGNENLEAVWFLRTLNEQIYGRFPDVMTIAEESTAWPQVSRPTSHGGLGFGFKWNMGWMHDTLAYMQLDPIYRKHHHDKLTFSMMYAFRENFLLPFSHDEVVHGKRSLLAKMPGDDWQKLANLRLLYAYMYMHPGKKLLFMGNEFAQRAEWDHDRSLDWHLLERRAHRGVQRLVADLNRLYRRKAALHQNEMDGRSFSWVDCEDWEASVVSFLRHGAVARESLLVVCNFTPVVREDYRLGVPHRSAWRELLNSDSEYYGGSNVGNRGMVAGEQVPFHRHAYSIRLTLPPLAAVVLEQAH